MSVTLTELAARLERVRRTGDRLRSRCPAHKGKSLNLSVMATTNGTLLVKCFRGCSVSDVCAALGIRLADLFADRRVA